MIPRRWMTINDITTGQTPEYPELQPRHYDRSPNEVFEAVRTSVRRMSRWRIVNEDLTSHRLEAEVKTFILPFIDDVTIWIEPESHGSRVMVRSHSRVGRGDLGENARTTRAFQRVLDDELKALKIGGEPNVKRET